MFKNIHIIKTEDGSTTLQDQRTGETYHSTYGAFAESLHIYIEYGLRYWRDLHPQSSCSILEMGFGTGLNVLLAYQEAMEMNLSTFYTSYELYPLDKEAVEGLQFPSISNWNVKELLQKIHFSEWGKEVQLSSIFTLLKKQEDFTKANFSEGIDLVFFDAFSPNVDPNLWTETVFRKIYQAQNQGGVLTTYCAKGQVRRTLQKLGYEVERLAGPKGKREVLRATKI